jgi:hypothetical protein
MKIPTQSSHHEWKQGRSSSYYLSFEPIQAGSNGRLDVEQMSFLSSDPKIWWPSEENILTNKLIWARLLERQRLTFFPLTSQVATIIVGVTFPLSRSAVQTLSMLVTHFSYCFYSIGCNVAFHGIVCLTSTSFLSPMIKWTSCHFISPPSGCVWKFTRF